jgi:hypothetical protein
MSPLLNKRDRIPNIVLTLPLDEALSDIEGILNLKRQCVYNLIFKNGKAEKKIVSLSKVCFTDSVDESYESVPRILDCKSEEFLDIF